MIIDYCKNGVAIGDEEALNYVADCHKLGIRRIKVSTENVLYAIRVLVKRGYLDHKRIKFRVEGKYLGIEIDKNGRVINWKDGFGGFTDMMLNELLDLY